jgi:Salmonella virulence plasmid 65kDa B protein/Insecticide toxin TcdB middle/N-terminal region
MLRTLSLFKSLVLATSALCLPLWIAAQNSVTLGEFQVTDAGASSYTIPLYTAPAAGNLDVKLALQYNSQSGNGVFGVGWSLTGVSSITRCPRTIAEEGERVGVKNNATDIFCLDGQKLRAVAGAYGAAGSEYRTAIDSYSKIVANGQQGTGPLSFTVYTKSGSIMEFGATDDSRLQHPVTGTARVWMVSQIRDRFHTTTNNSAINFTYSKDINLGEQLLREVRYNNGLLRLNYVARPANDPIIKYDDGVQLGSTNSRVSKIEVFDEPVVSGARQLRAFKEYRMAYVQSGATYRSLLTTVQECTPASVCLPAISVGYQNTGGMGSFVAGAAVTQAPEGYFIMDSDGKGVQKVLSKYDLANAIRTPTHDIYKIVAWDIDGDSRTDLDFAVAGGIGENLQGTQYLLMGGASTPSVVPTLNYQYYTRCYADINGDGISENITIARATNLIGEAIDSKRIKESLSGTYVDFGDPTSPEYFSDSCRAIDFDGDGRAEIFTHFGGIYTYRNGTLQQVGSIPTFYVNIGNNSQVGINNSFGDFNGDGKTDYLAQDQSSFLYNLNLSKGGLIGFAPVTPPLNLAGTWGGDSNVGCVADFNGDGRSDWLRLNDMKLMISTGNNFTEVATNLPIPRADLYTSVACGDFNGDGLADIVVNNNYWFSSTPGATDVVNQINNGLGNIHLVTYKSITDNNVYTKYANAARPQVDLQTPIQVVSRTQSGNNTQGWNNTNYRYEGLKADLHRRGTLGFAKVTSTNETTGIVVATAYSQNYPYIGLKTVQVKSKGAQTLDYTSYAYAARGYNAVGAYTAQSAQVITTAMSNSRYDLNNSFIGWEYDAYDIDGFGNATVHSKAQLELDQSVTSRKTTTNAYTNNTANWLIGQLTSSSTRSENLRGLPATSVGSVFGAGLQTGALSVGLSPSPLAAQRNNPGVLTASVTPTVLGGIGPYSYAWTKVTGSRIMPASTTATNASFSATMGWNENLNETVQLKVTDSKGAVTTAQLALSFKTPQPLAASVSPTAVTGWRGNPGDIYVASAVTPSGGFAPYTYSWVKLNGSRIGIINPSTANPTFGASVGWAENFTEAARVTVTDASGDAVSSDINVNFSTPAQLTAYQSLVSTSVENTYLNCPTIVFNVRAVPSGGAPPYSYQWSPAPYRVESAWSVSYAGFSYVTLTITDAAGNVAAVSNWYDPGQCDAGGSN